MFGVDMDKFINAMCKPRVKVGTEWVNKGQNAEQVSVIYITARLNQKYRSG